MFYFGWFLKLMHVFHVSIEILLQTLKVLKILLTCVLIFNVLVITWLTWIHSALYRLIWRPVDGLRTTLADLKTIKHRGPVIAEASLTGLVLAQLVQV
jgi:hypothetical protein